MMRKKKEKKKQHRKKGQLSSKGKHLRVFQRTSRSHLVVGKKDIKAKKKKEATRGRVRKKKTENKESSMYITHIKKKKKETMENLKMEKRNT